MPANNDIEINSAAYTLISTAIGVLTFQNKSNSVIELTAVATGDPVPELTVNGIEVPQRDGSRNWSVDETFLSIAGSKDVYAKTKSGAGKIFVNHA